MVIYSHSRLSTFEQCRLKFKYRYIDEIIPEVEQTIETHLGTCVHDTLEWLYNGKIKFPEKVLSLDDVINYYTESWLNQYSEEPVAKPIKEEKVTVPETTPHSDIHITTKPVEKIEKVEVGEVKASTSPKLVKRSTNAKASPVKREASKAKDTSIKK